MIQERVIYQRFCRMVKDKHIRAESLQELEWEQWLLKSEAGFWNIGQKLTMRNQRIWEEKTVPSSSSLMCGRHIDYRSQRGTG